MRFAEAHYLSLLFVLIPLFFFFKWALFRRKKKMMLFADMNLFKDIVPGFNLKQYSRKDFFLFLAFLFSLLALARPQWGFKWEEIKREGIDIIIAVDTSKSMLTQDVRPNRLERTKLAINDLVKQLKGDRIGLVAFAGDAAYVCPLTTDYAGFLLSLNDLDVDTINRGGTNISAAISKAMKGYEDIPSKYKAIILVTDGDNLEGDPVAVAEQAKKNGIKIYTVGIGTKEGDLIQLSGDSNETVFLKDREGNYVKSRLNEGVLQKIALLTDGIYVRAGGVQFGLDIIYQNHLSRLEKRDIEEKTGKRYFERFQIPLAIALLFLCLELCVQVQKVK